jgi:pimeloyl-ACP methyl ester carboxylesterase
MKNLLNALFFIIGVILRLLLIPNIVNAILLNIERKKLVPKGTLINVNNHSLHIYSQGDISHKPALVFMSGWGTPAPVYDFKPLYSLLSDEYHTVVVEKIGYGYADIVNSNRDIDILLEETRTALQSAGEKAPFVLFPHSMSGLEALYWLSKYPQEVAAIIGLDMVVPDFYIRPVNEQSIKEKIKSFYFNTIINNVIKTGLQRIPIISSPIISKIGLTDEEKKQAKYLAYRNFSNISIKNEDKSSFDNAEKVKNAFFPGKNGNVLLFSSDARESGEFWVSLQKEFALKINAELIILDCGHYVHRFESPKIAEKSKQFLYEIINYDK